MVHTHRRFFSRRLPLRLRTPPLVGDRATGVEACRPLATRRRTSSKGPGVCPPSRVSASAMAMSSDESPSEDEADGDTGVASSSARSSMCDLVYLVVVMVCVSGLL